MRTPIFLGVILVLALSVVSKGQTTAADFFNRGLERGKAKDADGAIADYAKAIELEPRMVAAYVNRSKARNAKGDFNGAISDTTRAIELGHPEIYLAYYHRVSHGGRITM
jgi:tetratricopeptide (TPR) repeat protein